VRTESWSPEELEYGTKYFWKVVARSADTETEGLTWWFVTESAPVPLPSMPSAPFPTDGATAQSRDIDLSWEPATGATLYKVVLGLVCGADGLVSLSAARYLPVRAGTAQYKTTYHWQSSPRTRAARSPGQSGSFATDGPGAARTEDSNGA